MKFFYGKWDSWGFEVSWCNSDKTFALSFVHWYFAICFWKLWTFDFKGYGHPNSEDCDTCEVLDKEVYTDKMDS
jgi:hypothetical protein